MSKLNQDLRPLGSPQSWARTPGTFISAQAFIDGADHVAVEMELKWGAGRLRLLVSPDLREKFDRQRYLLNQAIWHGDLEAVRVQSARMIKAWMSLDGAASEGEEPVLSPEVWEVVLADGTVAAIVRSPEEAHAVMAQASQERAGGRAVAVYTLEEIGRILSHHTVVTEAKLTWPGAAVTAVRRPDDPLDELPDSVTSLDDPLPYPLNPLSA